MTDMITIPRSELQQALDALERAISDDRSYIAECKASAEALRARLAQPEPEQEQRQRDMPCVEDDGCPTEKAVLQRFWRKHQQPEPEPVAWGVDEGEGRCISLHDLYFVKKDADHMAELKGTHAKVVPLYTAPPQREWQGLTGQETNHLLAANADCAEKLIRAIEAKLREKNT